MSGKDQKHPWEAEGLFSKRSEILQQQNENDDNQVETEIKPQNAKLQFKLHCTFTIKSSTE